MDTPRKRAMEILLHCQQRRLPVDRLLAEARQRAPLSEPRDAQLLMALVYGVLRWQGYLDLVLARFSRHPLARMKPLTRMALRLGVFQLLFMDRIPASAAINETVQTLKSAGQPQWLTGFVNGVLRAVSRNLDQLVPADSREAVLASHPSWLVKRWRQRYGEEVAAAICRVNNAQPPLTLRVNTTKTSRQQYLRLLAEASIAARAGEYAPEAVRLEEYRGKISALPGYAAGLFQVQDEAAQLVTLLLGELRPGRYLDACAGLGGKTGQLAQAARQRGGVEVVAVEPDRHRREKLMANLQRLGLAVTVLPARLQAVAGQNLPPFQGVLVDAPCSGLGVIRRQPDIRWHRRPADLGRYQRRQRELLETAATMVAAGGVLVYVTCSTEPEENQAVVAGFLASHPSFTLVDARGLLPTPARSLVAAEGWFQSLPHQGLDGFFAARFQRRQQDR